MYTQQENKVKATSIQRINVESTLFQRCVPAGILNPYKAQYKIICCSDYSLYKNKNNNNKKKKNKKKEKKKKRKKKQQLKKQKQKKKKKNNNKQTKKQQQKERKKKNKKRRQKDDIFILPSQKIGLDISCKLSRCLIFSRKNKRTVFKCCLVICTEAAVWWSPTGNLRTVNVYIWSECNGAQVCSGCSLLVYGSFGLISVD